MFKTFIFVGLLILASCGNNEIETPKKDEEKDTEECTTLGEECEGGYLAYIDDDSKLIVAPLSSEGFSQWGCRDQEMNITSDEYGKGMENTNNIIEWHIGWEEPWFTGPSSGYCHEKNDGTIAAQYCELLSENDYNDWYLPSKSELAFVYENLRYLDNAQFQRVEYWSSSEFSGGSAWVKDFRGGQEYGYQKTFERTIRCFRSVR